MVERSVPIPQSADEAELMAKIGLMWLQEYAPERLGPMFRNDRGQQIMPGIFDRHGRAKAKEIDR